MTHDGDIGHWETADGARMRAVHRPDGAGVVRLPDDRPDQWPALVEAATHDGCGTLLLSRPAVEDEQYTRLLHRVGCTPVRTDTGWRRPTHPRLATPVRTEPELVSAT